MRQFAGLHIHKHLVARQCLLLVVPGTAAQSKAETCRAAITSWHRFGVYDLLSTPRYNPTPITTQNAGIAIRR
jgi:hypothetical protein